MWQSKYFGSFHFRSNSEDRNKKESHKINYHRDQIGIGNKTWYPLLYGFQSILLQHFTALFNKCQFISVARKVGNQWKVNLLNYTEKQQYGVCLKHVIKLHCLGGLAYSGKFNNIKKILNFYSLLKSLFSLNHFL